MVTKKTNKIDTIFFVRVQGNVAKMYPLLLLLLKCSQINKMYQIFLFCFCCVVFFELYQFLNYKKKIKNNFK